MDHEKSMIETPVEESEENKESEITTTVPWFEKLWLLWVLQSQFESTPQQIDLQQRLSDIIINRFDWKLLWFSLEWNFLICHTNWEKGAEKWYINLKKIDLEAIEYLSAEEIFQEKERKNHQVHNDLEKLDTVLNAMDSVFHNNEKELFDYLWDDDTYSNNTPKEESKSNLFWESLEWKNLLELQSIADSILNWLWWLKNTISENPKYQDDYVWSHKRYLEFLMWIWDTYEWWAKYLKKTPKQIEDLVDNILSSMSISYCLDYLVNIHEKIDSNNYQSISVERSYEQIARKLHLEIFKKMINDADVSDQDFLKFSKIITGRNFEEKSVRNPMSNSEHVVYTMSNIDDNLKDPELANNILLYMMYRENGIISKLQQESSFKIEDKKLWEKKPVDIASGLVSSINNRKISLPNWNLVDGNNFVKGIFWINIKEIEWVEYKDLSLENKIIISTMFRLEKKIRVKNTRWARTGYVQKKLDIQGLDTALKEVAQESYELIGDSFKDSMSGWWWNFNGDPALSLEWLSDIQKESLKLFNDINGIGAFDLSDKSWKKMKTWAKIWAVIWLALLVWWPMAAAYSSSLIIQWATIGATASVISIWWLWKWYDTKNEAIVDIWSDIIVWSATWAIWWVVAWWLWISWQRFFATKLHIDGNKSYLIWKWLWEQWAAYLSKWWVTNAWIFAWDLAVLWLWAEWHRSNWSENKFHWDSIYSSPDKKK